MIFRELANHPRPSYTIDEDPKFIIDVTSIRLAHAYIGMESLTDAFTIINETFNASPSPRTKPLLATLRGIGGGKTRFLEEIRNYYQSDSSTLSIAITFNSNSEFDIEEESLFPGLKPNQLIVLSVITGVISAFFCYAP